MNRLNRLIIKAERLKRRFTIDWKVNNLFQAVAGEPEEDFEAVFDVTAIDGKKGIDKISEIIEQIANETDDNLPEIMGGVKGGPSLS